MGISEDDDDDFESFEIDQADLDRIDALEAAQQRGSKKANNNQGGGASTQQINLDDDDDDLLIDESGDWNDSNFLNELIKAENKHDAARRASSKVTPAARQQQQQQQQQAIAGPSSHRRRPAMPSSSSSGSVSTGKTRQRTLFGGTAPVQSSSSQGRQRTLFGEIAPVQSSQGMLLVATKAHTSRATASQTIQAAAVNPNHRFFVEGKSKRKEWDKSQPLTVKKNKSSSYEDDDLDDLQACWDLANNAEDVFVGAPPPPLPDT